LLSRDDVFLLNIINKYQTYYSLNFTTMKTLTTFIVSMLILACSTMVFGQWSGTGPVWTSDDVGIGTAFPADKLEIQNGDLRFDFGSTTFQGLRFHNGVTDRGHLGKTGPNFYFWNRENGFIRFGTNNTTRMQIHSTGNVGIGTGTAAPAARLELQFTGRNGLLIDGSNTGDAFIQIENGGGDHFIFDDDSDGHSLDIESAGELNFNTGGPVERMSLSATGILSINKSSEALRLNGSGSYMSFYNGSIYNGFLWHNNTNMYLTNRHATGNLNLGAGNATRITINANGNVGIGQATASDKLHIKGDARMDDPSPTLSFFNGTDDQGQLKSIASQIEIESGQGDNIRLDAGGTVSGPGSIFMETSNSIRMTIDETGDVTMTGKNIETGSSAGTGIANITIGAGRIADGQSSFQLVADESIYSDWGVKFARFGNGFSRFTHRGTNAFQFMSAHASNIGFLTNSILRMTIEHTTGDVGIGISNPTSRLHVAGDIFATGTITSSDRRLKRDIDNYSAGLDEVMKLRPVTYFYNGEAGIRSDIKHVGLIAQELETIQPELVGDYLYQNKDMWDNVTEEGTYKYIQEGAIKYMLVNAVQQQQDQIEETEVDVDALQAEIAELKALVQEMQKVLVNLQNEKSEVVNVQVHKKYLELNGANSVAILEQNQPNPFTENTLIKYYLPGNATGAHINIFTAEGKLLKTLKITESGHGQLSIKANSLPAGNYVYQLITDTGIVANKTMVLQ
jgi:hypothetical protein